MIYIIRITFNGLVVKDCPNEKWDGENNYDDIKGITNIGIKQES